MKTVQQVTITTTRNGGDSFDSFLTAVAALAATFGSIPGHDLALLAWRQAWNGMPDLLRQTVLAYSADGLWALGDGDATVDGDGALTVVTPSSGRPVSIWSDGHNRWEIEVDFGRAGSRNAASGLLRDLCYDDDLGLAIICLLDDGRAASGAEALRAIEEETE